MSYDERDDHDDEYSGMRPLVEVASNNDSFRCDLTLKQIQKELKKLTDMAHKGIDIDEARFDYLLRAQEHNEEYKLWLAEEKATWRESVYEFAEQCLERTRTFVPVNVFESSVDDLIQLGLTPELAKRVLQRQCLWLVRMSKAEIASLHESDLLGRYNSSAQLMDIIETAAIYIALPERFNGDELGRKAEWRDRIEENLRRMLQDNDDGQLADGRLRNAAYDGLQFGPVEDVTSVRATNIISGRHSHRPRRSFMEVCKNHSILSAVKAEDPAPDSSDSENEGEAGKFQDEYEEEEPAEEEEQQEEEDEAEEEVYEVSDESKLKFGSSASLLHGPGPVVVQAATGYATRDFLGESFDEQDDEEEEALINLTEEGEKSSVEEAETPLEDALQTEQDEVDAEPAEQNGEEDAHAPTHASEAAEGDAVVAESGDQSFEQSFERGEEQELEEEPEQVAGDARVVDDAIIDQLAQLEAEAVAEIAAAMQARLLKEKNSVKDSSKEKDTDYCIVDRAGGDTVEAEVAEEVGVEEPDHEAVEMEESFAYDGDDLSSSSSEGEEEEEEEREEQEEDEDANSFEHGPAGEEREEDGATGEDLGDERSEGEQEAEKEEEEEESEVAHASPEDEQ